MANGFSEDVAKHMYLVYIERLRTYDDRKKVKYLVETQISKSVFQKQFLFVLLFKKLGVISEKKTVRL